MCHVLYPNAQHLTYYRALKSRDVMTAMEKSAVETFIKPHQYGRGSKVLHNTINYLVNIRNSKVTIKSFPYVSFGLFRRRRRS